MHSKNIIVVVVILILIGIGGYFLNQSLVSNTTVTIEREPAEEMLPVEPDEGIGDGAESLDELLESERPAQEVIGTSVTGQAITAYHFGTGETEILFIGGSHGSYSWNTSLLAFELIEHFETNPAAVPENVTVTIIPALNPDGLLLNFDSVDSFSRADALGLSEAQRVAGRFNGNTVDLNRNFDCDWQSTGTWRSREVSGGRSAFSEPEAAALRDYVNRVNPTAAVVWFSAEGKVYPSACAGSASSASETLATTFAADAGYAVEEEFDAYAITGDMVNWLAKENIPAISVLLTNHQDTEFDKNLAGVTAVLASFAN